MNEKKRRERKHILLSLWGDDSFDEGKFFLRGGFAYKVSTLQNRSIYNAVMTLTPRERKIIILRFGLGDWACHTLQEVANNLHISRDRVRQIEAKALAKMRHPNRMRILLSRCIRGRMAVQ